MKSGTQADGNAQLILSVTLHSHGISQDKNALKL